MEYETEILDNTARLEQANKDLDHFAYMASHDLKAPLKGMSDLTQWIAEDLGDALTPEVERMLDLLRGRVRRMDALLKDIYGFSRAGTNLGEREKVDMGEILDEVTAWLSPAWVDSKLVKRHRASGPHRPKVSRRNYMFKPIVECHQTPRPGRRHN